jgi:hypothetical protein
MNQLNRIYYIFLLLILLCACNSLQHASPTTDEIHASKESGYVTTLPIPTVDHKTEIVRTIQVTEEIPTPTDALEKEFSFGLIKENFEGRIVVFNGGLHKYQIMHSDKTEDLQILPEEYPVFAGFSASGVLAYAFNGPEFYLRYLDNSIRSVPINSHDVYNLLPEDAKIWGWQSIQWINEYLLYGQLLYTTEPDQVKKAKLSIVFTVEGKLREDLFQKIPDRLTGSGVIFSPTLEEVVYAEKGTFLMKSVLENEVIYTDKTFDNLLFAKEGQIFEVSWSPDGANVVYGNLGTFTLGVILADNKGNGQKISPKGYQFTGGSGFSWSSDSRYLTFVGTDSKNEKNQFLYIYDVIEKRIVFKIKTEEKVETPIIQWSPYDLQFAISDWTYKGIYLYDLEKGLKEQLVEKGKVFSWGK